MSSGIFYILADYERKQSEAVGTLGKNLFRDAFGDIYKHYVGLQLKQGSETEALIDLDTLQHNGLKPDFALITGNRIVLLEIKVSFLTSLSKVLGDEVKIKKEISRTDGQFAKALNQLNTFEEAINAGTIADRRFSGKKEIIKIIVSYEDFYLANSYLLNLATAEFGEKLISNLQIMTLMDIDACGTVLANGGKVVDYLFNKVSDPEFKAWSVDAFIRNSNKGLPNKNPLLDENFKEFFNELTGKSLYFEKLI